MLRQKLLVAGIPESEHAVESLVAKIPDFNARAFEGHRQRHPQTSVTSDKALLDMPCGSHMCQFYSGKEDLVVTVRRLELKSPASV